MLNKLRQALTEALDFQARVWVVSVSAGEHKGESYVVNEDGFKEPMQWMKSKGYSQAMIDMIDKMPRSQVKEFQLEAVTHQLMRVK